MIRLFPEVQVSHERSLWKRPPALVKETATLKYSRKMRMREL